LQEGLQKGDIEKRNYNSPTKAQAKNYAERFNINLTPELTFLYGFLRQEVEMPLSDQEVFAEVLLITHDYDKYKEFTSAYPKIFKKQS
jgi:hypothetical protein